MHATLPVSPRWNMTDEYEWFRNHNNETHLCEYDIPLYRYEYQLLC